MTKAHSHKPVHKETVHETTNPTDPKGTAMPMTKAECEALVTKIHGTQGFSGPVGGDAQKDSVERLMQANAELSSKTSGFAAGAGSAGTAVASVIAWIRTVLPIFVTNTATLAIINMLLDAVSHFFPATP